MKEVLKVLRDLRIETSDRNNYSQSYAFGYTDAISDAIQAVKKMNYIPCCKSDSEQLKVVKVKEFWQFKNTYLIDKQLNKDPFRFKKDLKDIELVDKYALYLKNNL